MRNKKCIAIRRPNHKSSSFITAPITSACLLMKTISGKIVLPAKIINLQASRAASAAFVTIFHLTQQFSYKHNTLLTQARLVLIEVLLVFGWMVYCKLAGSSLAYNVYPVVFSQKPLTCYERMTQSEYLYVPSS